MNIAFVLSKVEEARLIKGVASEKNHNVLVYEKPEELLSLNFIPDCVVVDFNSINERDDRDLRIILSSSDRILFILPFWVDAPKKINEIREKCKKLGLRKKKIKVIKRPFTPDELINYIEFLFAK